VAYSEIERFPSEVLAHHYPSTPNLGDMTKFKEWNFESDVDLLVGGTPCQSFSVAGLRKGLDDPRGNLMLTYLAIADKYRPRWLVWENVPGVLSSNGGKDFGVFLGALGELRYGFAYRVLDAQYFGVAQRRRRVFVVGYLGDWRAAAAVLFERHSLQGHPAPSREKRKSVAASVASGPPFSRTGNDRVECEAMVVSAMTYDRQSSGEYGTAPVASTVAARDYKGPSDLVAQPTIVHGTQDPCVSDIAFAQGRNNGGENVLVQAVGTDLYNGAITGEVACTMSTHGGDGNGTGPTVMQAMAVRRLTPVECERLQGFPDSYTDIKSKDKPTPDGPRYKALGNSMAVPVMAWIGQRIQEVEAICKQNK
jgi:DNA (cytosine-5)-methyltransferase 1